MSQVDTILRGEQLSPGFIIFVVLYYIQRGFLAVFDGNASVSKSITQKNVIVKNLAILEQKLIPYVGQYCRPFLIK